MPTISTTAIASRTHYWAARQDLVDLIGDLSDLIFAGRTVILDTSDSVATITAALQAGGHVHFSAGTYDLTSVSNSTALTADLLITGDGRDRVTIRVADDPEAAPGIGTECFVFSGERFRLRGVKVIGERIGFSLQGLDSRVEEFTVEDCWFEDTSAGIKLDTTSASAGTELGLVRFNRNVCRNVNSGVALRLGDGSSSVAHDIPIDYFEAVGNDLETVDKYGIVCNYDDVDSSYTYSVTNSFARAVGNRIVDLEGRIASSTVTGFGINLTAARYALVESNYLEDVIQGERVNIEPIYTKSPNTMIRGNMVVNCDGDQGAIALKAEDGASSVHCIGNTILAQDLAMLNGIWVQTQNAFISGNRIEGIFTNSAIKTGGSASLDNMLIQDNELVCDGSGGDGSHGIRVDTSVANLTIKGNRIRRIADSSGSWKGILVTLGDGDAVPDPVIADNEVRRVGAGTETIVGVELSPHASGPITDPQIMRNHFLDIDTGIGLETAACTGTVLVQGNSEVGVTTEVDDNAVNTVDAQFNSWN